LFKLLKKIKKYKKLNEFDSGSAWMLAIGLTHVSWTQKWNFDVASGWVKYRD